MSPGARILIIVAFCSIANLESCHSYVYEKAKIVTYGDPCVEPRQLPIKIEGPKPPAKDVKVPVSLDFRVVSDMYVQPPHHVEYPIAIEMPVTTKSVPKLTVIKDPFRGKSYAYNRYVPPVANPPLLKNYDFAVDIPVMTKPITLEQTKKIYVPRLKGLVSRVDRILEPACKKSPSSVCTCSVN